MKSKILFFYNLKQIEKRVLIFIEFNYFNIYFFIILYSKVYILFAHRIVCLLFLRQFKIKFKLSINKKYLQNRLKIHFINK